MMWLPPPLPAPSPSRMCAHASRHDYSSAGVLSSALFRCSCLLSRFPSCFRMLQKVPFTCASGWSKQARSPANCKRSQPDSIRGSLCTRNTCPGPFRIPLRWNFPRGFSRFSPHVRIRIIDGPNFWQNGKKISSRETRFLVNWSSRKLHIFKNRLFWRSLFLFFLFFFEFLFA